MTNWKKITEEINNLKPLYEKSSQKVLELEKEIETNPDKNKIKKLESLINSKTKYEETAKDIQTISFFSEKNEKPEEFIENLCDIKALTKVIDELKTELNEI